MVCFFLGGGACARLFQVWENIDIEMISQLERKSFKQMLMMLTGFNSNLASRLQ